MYNIVYFGTIIGLILSLVILVFMHRHSGRFLGHTLSQWVAQTRKKQDEISADKLLHVRKLLECLAHDVLKHRLLGLHSLFEEMQQYYGGSGKKKLDFRAISPEKDVAFRDEFFRLCGIKARPEERLWTRFSDAFKEIYHYTGKRLALPMVDPMFSAAFKVLVELRRAMVWLVNTDSMWAKSSVHFYKILSLDYVSVYPATLALAASCRMEIDPNAMIQGAIEAVAAQTNRADIANRIRIYRCDGDRLLCDAPMRTLTMCMTRLLDNALEQSRNVAIEAAFLTDEFTGVSKLIIKVYDESEGLPATADEGMGMRGVRQNLEAFSGGIAYRSEVRDSFKKAAVLSISASRFEPVVETKLRRSMVVEFIAVAAVNVAIFLICFANVIGGPPVEFAGKGTDIVEFYAEVGKELAIPLCTGGRNVRAEVRAENIACVAEQCTLARVLEELEPCKKSINDPECPGVLRWTPQFSDGQRQGRNYELSIDCIADGPPPSEDTRRIRVRVLRPNSAPKIAFVQIINDTKGTMHYLTKRGEMTRVDVNDKLRLRVLANDADADIIMYRLRSPDGTVVVSTDGTFDLSPKWSAFATSTFELEISDNIAASLSFNIVLAADKLHPIEIVNADIVTSTTSVRLPCDGTPEARVCRVPDRNINELRIIVRFDPLQSRIRPVVAFQVSDNHGIDLRYIRQYSNKTGETQLGDQWEVYSKSTQQLIAVVELTNIEKLPSANDYAFTFRMLSNVHSSENSSFAVYANVSDLSDRMPAAKSLFIFAFAQQKSSKYVFTSQHLQLREYEAEQDAQYAEDGTWIYPVEGEKLRQEPVVDRIDCQTPEFASAFETPSIQNLKNAWRIDFKLKRGCIPGLAVSLPAKERLCTAHIGFGNRPPEKEIWIMLDARQCAPRIDELALVAQGTDDSTYRYAFTIVDTDGDLSKNKIQVLGNAPHEIAFGSGSHALGDVYRGEIRIKSDCDFSEITPLTLVATDETGRTTQKVIALPQVCPATIDTEDGRKFFEVSEGTLMEIPIVAENDAKLLLKSNFGRIENGAFRWLASCSYGAGPHRIEIRDALHPNAHPIEIEIELRCMPRLSVSIDDAPIQLDIPFDIAPNTEHRVKISGVDAEQFEFNLASSALYPSLRLTESIQDGVYGLGVACASQEETQESIQIQVVPKDPAKYIHPDPIVMTFRCLAPPNTSIPIPSS